MENYDVDLDHSLQFQLHEVSPISPAGIYSSSYDVVVCESVSDFTSNFSMIHSGSLTLLLIGCVFYACVLNVVKSIVGSLVGGKRS